MPAAGGALWLTHALPGPCAPAACTAHFSGTISGSWTDRWIGLAMQHSTACQQLQGVHNGRHMRCQGHVSWQPAQHAISAISMSTRCVLSTLQDSMLSVQTAHAQAARCGASAAALGGVWYTAPDDRLRWQTSAGNLPAHGAEGSMTHFCRHSWRACCICCTSHPSQRIPT